jgi:hypothetical protein
MVAAFCEEQLAQGLIPERMNPDVLFADFESLPGADEPEMPVESREPWTR